MIPLVVLFAASLAALFVIRMSTTKFDLRRAARIGMSFMLVFTAIGHFLYPEGMALMIPDPIPFKKELIFSTALLEIGGAIGLQVLRYRTLIGWCLVVFFLAVLPANIYAALENINYQTASFDGPGLQYLWFRIPLQILFIAWIYFSTLKSSSK